MTMVLANLYNRLSKLARTASLALAITLALSVPAAAQTLSLDLGGDTTTTSRIVQLIALLTVA